MIHDVQYANFLLLTGFPSLSGEEAKSLRYKAPQTATKTGGPWGSKRVFKPITRLILIS
jgi:hypothetical protein